MFFISGLVVNFFQALFFVTVRPFSKNTYRRINRVLAELLWLEVVWLVDWWAGLKRSGCLGSAIAVMKKSLKYLPIIGWSMWFNEYLFLERNWVKDEKTIKTGRQRLRDYPLPFWLALFVEGTCFTEAKLCAAQEYASSTGFPVDRNVLIPRTKVPKDFLLNVLGEERVTKFVIQEMEGLVVKENKLNTTQTIEELQKMFSPCKGI